MAGKNVGLAAEVMLTSEFLWFGKPFFEISIAFTAFPGIINSRSSFYSPEHYPDEKDV